jgi:hypothetical protein
VKLHLNLNSDQQYTIQVVLERHAPRLVRFQDEVEENDRRPGNCIRIVKSIIEQ